MSSIHHAWASGQAADAYFERNRHKLNADSRPGKSASLFASYLQPTHRILEIGSANGRVLEQLRLLTGCEAHGIDPSPRAIEEGSGSYPQVHLSVGTADALNYPDSFFDAVLFGFCLYLVDRNVLTRVVSEADRILSGRAGRLMITDWDPVMPHRRPFKHQEGLWSYKMQYPDLWLANPAYRLAEKVSFSHSGDEFHPDPGERVGSWVLIKDDQRAYPADADA